LATSAAGRTVEAGPTKGVDMTSERARAYARVMLTLRDIGPAKLRSSEQAVTRLAAANSLLFCADIVNVRSARAAFSDFDAMRQHLVATGRWTAQRAAQFADDVWACGPAFDVALRAA
jgi:hypothetical protein